MRRPEIIALFTLVAPLTLLGQKPTGPPATQPQQITRSSLETKIPEPVPVTIHDNGLVAVEFRQGQLTVAADDAKLGKVLSLIGDKTGANIEIAPEVAGEPVAARLGPGSPSEILTALLSSPSLDFIIIGSDEQGMIQRLVVRKRASFGREPVAKRQTQAERPKQPLETQESAEENPPQVQEAAQQPPQEQPQGNSTQIKATMKKSN